MTIFIFDFVRLLGAADNFWHKELEVCPTIDLHRPMSRLHLCATTDWASVHGEQVPYDIQIDFNIELCRFEAFIDDQLADTCAAASYEAAARHIDSACFDSLVARYISNGEAPPPTVAAALEGIGCGAIPPPTGGRGR